ncbi:MAG: alkaline phosphatase family protein [Planctomycetota bacterium]
MKHRKTILTLILPALLSCGTAQEKYERLKQGTEPDRPGMTVPPAPLGPGEKPIPPKVVVLSVPGLDPERVEQGMKDGWLPSFRRLRTNGTLARTAAPLPPSATATCASFLTGSGLERHQIAGDVRRGFQEGAPVPVPGGYRVDWVPREELFPRGAPEGYPERFPVVRSNLTYPSLPALLNGEGLRTRILRSEIGFSALVGEHTEVLGAGAMPDLSFEQGSYTFAIEDPSMPERQRTGRGGILLRSLPSTTGREFDTFLVKVEGPPGLLPGQPGRIETVVKVRLSKGRARGTAETAEDQVELLAGRWSRPLVLRFSIGPSLDLFGRSRLYLRPTGKKSMELYIDPPDFVPARTPPWQSLSYPEDWAGELERHYGPLPRFSSAFPADALVDGLLDGRDAAAALAASFEAEQRLMEAQLVEGNFDLFYQSFSLLEETALVGPGANEEIDFFGQRVTRLRLLDAATAAVDRLLGAALAVMDSGKLGEQVTIILLSPYGASPALRFLDLNRLLVNRGDLFLSGAPELPFRERIDWSRTKAYSLGYGGVYVNVQGREPQGVLSREEATSYISALEADLLQVRDTVANENVVKTTWRFTTFAPELDNHGFPDLVVGLGKGYTVDRSAGWFRRIGPLLGATGTGAGPGSAANTPAAVPGMLGISRIGVTVGLPTPQDVGATVLELLGVRIPESVTGKPLELGMPMQIAAEETLEKGE